MPKRPRDVQVRVLFYRERIGYDGDPFYHEIYTGFSPPISPEGAIVSIGASAYKVVETCFWYRRYHVDVGILLTEINIASDKKDEDPDEKSLSKFGSELEESLKDESEEDLGAEIEAGEE